MRRVLVRHRPLPPSNGVKSWLLPAKTQSRADARSVIGQPAKSPKKLFAVRLSPRFPHGIWGPFLKEAALKPHRIRYWLTPPPDPLREERTREVCPTYEQAKERAQRGERTLSTDEMTGVQALQRKSPGLPMHVGKVACREHEYIRHGTRAFIVNFDVVTGQVQMPSCGPTRTEADFAAHIVRTVDADPQVTRWHFVVDNLNIHQSVSLVLLVANRDGITADLGAVGKRGVLQSLQTRAAFLSEASHSIVFHYTPRHSSWLNQIEIWFSILARKLLKRTSFCSVEDLEVQVLAFIAYYNATMAKAFQWTYKGKPLTI
jgi:transposase